MAGAGYKLFNTGDVLTAAQVNTYLQEQVVMVFNDATARTTALSGVLAEGMVSYLKSTKVVEIYNGTAWASLDDPNAIQNTIVDAKGDLIAATANDTPARLAVGTDGQVLTADSSTATGLKWAAAAAGGDTFAAGKNKIINGDFRINQRSFTSVTADVTYGFDRWMLMRTGGTVTYSPQTFTPGTAPVAGYEGVNFARIATSGQSAAGDYSILSQRIEDVRTLANQTVTVSFWAKANSGTPKVAVEFVQNFGTGGTPSSDVNTYISNVTLSTSWARYSVTGTVPSISGKTIGTDANSSSLRLYLWTSAGSTFNSRTGSIGVQNSTIDFWGVQAENGSSATTFQTATGTIPGELAACQRYFYNHISNTSNNSMGIGYYYSATEIQTVIPFPVTMRIAPTLVATSGASYYIISRNGGSDEFNSWTIQRPSRSAANLKNTTEASGTAGQAGTLETNNTSASVSFDSEL